MTALRSVFAALSATALLFCATLAVAQPYPMPPEPSRPTPDQPALGQDSFNGATGRTMGMDTICGACQVEKYTSECVGRMEGPNFDKDGNLWMVSPGTGDIYRVTPDRHCQVVALTPAPNGLRFGPDGKLYGVDKKEGLFWIDTKTFKVTFLTNGDGSNFHGLDDLYIDHTGGIYMTDAYGSGVLNPQGQVFYYTPQGKVRKLVSGNLAFPNGIVLSPDEKMLYIDDYNASRIIAVPVTAPGELSLDNSYVFAYLNGGHGPDSMSIDSQGNVYAAHYGGGEVAVFNPRGLYYGAIRLPPGAGTVVSNMTFHDGYLYITEMDKHTVWRVKAKIPGMTP